MLISWAELMPGLIVPVLGFAERVVTFGVAVFRVSEMSLRQQITPEAMQGRMHATMGCWSAAATRSGRWARAWSRRPPRSAAGSGC